MILCIIVINSVAHYSVHKRLTTILLKSNLINAGIWGRMEEVGGGRGGEGVVTTKHSGRIRRKEPPRGC